MLVVVEGDDLPSVSSSYSCCGMYMYMYVYVICGGSCWFLHYILFLYRREEACSGRAVYVHGRWVQFGRCSFYLLYIFSIFSIFFYISILIFDVVDDDDVVVDSN